MLPEQTCGRCKKTYSPKDRNQRGDVVAIHQIGICKDCIVGCGKWSQRKSASIIRKFNKTGSLDWLREELEVK